MGSTDSFSPVQGSFPAPTWNWRLPREGYPQIGLPSSWTSQMPHTFLLSTTGVAQPQRWDTPEVMGSQAGWPVAARV